MQIKTEKVDGVTKASLNGKLDIAGAGAIDLPFNVMVGSQKAIVVDLSGVTFIASMGLRTLILGAKTVASKGGKMVLFGPSEDVQKVLEDSGTTTIIPVLHDFAKAVEAVSPRP